MTNQPNQDKCALPKKSGLSQSAQRTSENSPALECWGTGRKRPQSVKRMTDKTGKALRIQPSVSRTVACDRADPTDKSVGYFQSSASPTFWANPDK